MNNMRFIIRKAEEKDLPCILQLFEKKNDFSVSSPGKEKKLIFANMLKDNAKHILVGEKNGVITAFISMKIEAAFENFLGLTAYITDIKTDMCHAEILTAILSRATAIAMENGCRSIVLCDNFVNAESNAVYSICNFRQSNTVYFKNL